jgi:hypothetical protein
MNDPPKEERRYPKKGAALPQEGSGATPRGERGMPGARCTRSRVREV